MGIKIKTQYKEVSMKVSFTSSGMLIAHVSWPQAFKEEDRNLDFRFDGRRWIRIDKGSKVTSKVTRHSGYGGVLYPLSDKILGTELVTPTGVNT